MLVKKEEVEELARQLEMHFTEEVTANQRSGHEDQFPCTYHVYRNPHLLLALGFDEYRLIEESDDDAKSIERQFRHVEGASFPLGYEALFRTETGGEWRLFQGFKLNANGGSSLDLSFVGEEKNHTIQCSEWLKNLMRLVEQPKETVSTLSFSRLWIPKQKILSESPLARSTKDIIRTIHGGYESLRQIHWRTLEEIVAELLRAQGLQVHLTPRTSDGGRDIIARGELVPGEPMTLAIEVKNKDVVGIDDARRALHANQQFPSLMLVTAGVFSAGVVQEKRRNSLRLFLKDGIALQQWIRSYCEVSPHDTLNSRSCDY